MDPQELNDKIDQLDSKISDIERAQNEPNNRINQWDILPDVVKTRHMGEGNRYIVAGPAADRIDAATLEAKNTIYATTAYFSTDTRVWNIWNGTSWTQFSATPTTTTLTGFGFVLGDGTSQFLTKAVTFSTAYTSAPVVLVSLAGLKDTTDPTLVSDFTVNNFGSGNELSVSTYGITTTGFNISMGAVTGAGFINLRRFGFNWISVGT